MAAFGGPPQAMASSLLTRGDGINRFDKLPAIADRPVSENRERPPWLGRLS
jgi:hypothetical protein